MNSEMKTMVQELMTNLEGIVNTATIYQSNPGQSNALPEAMANEVSNQAKAVLGSVSNIILHSLRGM